MIQTKTIVVIVIAIAIGTLGITTTTMSSATASNGAHTDCLSRGLIPGCSPGQHFDARLDNYCPSLFHAKQPWIQDWMKL
jgi:hypothetical protein